MAEQGEDQRARSIDLPAIREAGDDELRRSAARYRALVDATTTMTVAPARDGSFAVPQERWEAYTGQSFAEHRGYGWLRMLHDEDRRPAQETFGHAVRDRRWWERKVRVFHAASGEHRWCVLRAAPVLDEKGELVEWFGIGVDIHPQQTAEIERARLERELRASEADFRTLAETLPQLVWTARPDGAVDSFNERWYAFTGGTPETDLGWGWTRVLSPTTREATLAAWRRTVASGSTLEQDVLLRGADGVERWFLVRAVALGDAEGRVVRWFGTATDVDERKRLAEELAEANRQKNQFLAMLAHELRNPLAPIRNATEVLRLGARDSETIEWARVVVDRQVHHLARLVDDLLDVSRISEGKITLQREPVELLSAVAAAIEIVRPTFDARKQELRLALPREPVRLDADPTRFAQVIANLLDNASKYSETGGVVELEAEVGAGEVVLRVRDRGVGIAADMLEPIFELFTQADRSLARSQGGLGIGLTLVRRLVELHGGTVTAASAGLGHGSEFTVRLPTVTEPRAAPPPTIDRPPAPSARRVLVVDDAVDAAESLAMLLELSGHVVEVAHEATSALERARAFAPDVALLDIGLPGIDGYELGARLRERLGRSVLLVAVTGYGRTEDRERSERAGFDLHLVKPLDPNQLSRLLESRVGASAAGGGGA